MIVAIIAFTACIIYFLMFALCKTAKEADELAKNMYIKERRKLDEQNNNDWKINERR